MGACDMYVNVSLFRVTQSWRMELTQIAAPDCTPQDISSETGRLGRAGLKSVPLFHQTNAEREKQ